MLRRKSDQLEMFLLTHAYQCSLLVQYNQHILIVCNRHECDFLGFTHLKSFKAISTWKTSWVLCICDHVTITSIGFSDGVLLPV